MRARSRSEGGLTVQELRETRAAALFHEQGAAVLAKSTLTRVALRAQTATPRCADDPGIDLASVIDSVATHLVAVAAATQRLTGEVCLNESLASRSPVPTVTARAISPRPSSRPVDLRRSHLSS
jgi:hypothetical protein